MWFEGYNLQSDSTWSIANHYITCNLNPTLGCIFFNSTCVASLPNDATRHVNVYFTELEEDLAFPALASFFVDALVTFTLARFGGVPVPVSTRLATVCWCVRAAHAASPIGCQISHEAPPHSKHMHI